jgi:tRNA(Ser,Leu) C12 N-acetylase TAN1
MLSLLQILTEVKRIGPEYETAAKMLQIRARRAGFHDFSEDMPEMKYGAFSGEAWYMVASVMNTVGISTDQDDFDKISNFVDLLKKANLIHLEW